MENQLQQRNVSGVWKSLKTISGQRTPDSQAAGDQMWVNNMNLFFNRFDQTPTAVENLLRGTCTKDPSPKRLQ